MEEQIVRDVMRKCGDDVADAIERNARLIDDKLLWGAIAGEGMAAAIGTAAAFLSHAMKGATPEEVVDALWERFRPAAVRAAQEWNAQPVPLKPDAIRRAMEVSDATG